MEGTSSAAVARWIDTLSGTVIPIKPRTALRDVIAQRDINGLAFSMVLNKHALADFNVSDLSLAMATKVRKCWHADFPESVGIKPQDPVREEDQSQRHDPCQDGVDYSGYEGYAGYNPGPRTGCGALSRSSAGGHGGGSGRSGHAPAARASANNNSNRPIPMVSISLEVLRAALDCVAERSDLNRQEMYLGLRDVMPDEVWNPLWASYTSDLVRERHIDVRANMEPNRGAKPSHLPRKSHKVQQSACKDSTSALRGFEALSSSTQDCAPRASDAYSNSPQTCPPQDELAQLPELKSRLGGKRQRGPEQGLDEQDFQRDDDLHSQAETLRSEAETMASDAMSHWLGNSMVTRSALSPFELANWLRMLPKDRLEDNTLKSVARHVLDKSMDEDKFEAALAAGGFASFGVTDQRQAQILERYFKQRQSEAAMAEAAKQAGALNRQFNAKLESKAWQS